MHGLSALVLAALLSYTEAKICQNLSIPVQIDARTGIFNLSQPTDATDLTTFAQHLATQGANYTEQLLTGYNTTSGTYNISATYCKPSNATSNSSATVQFLTHGIGFDKSYWDLPYNDYSYSYVNVAVDQYGYSTLAIDRLGTGMSSHADPISVVQAASELSAIYQITTMLRLGAIPALNGTRPSKIVHVGHSFGSALSYSLSAMYPNATDGLILTGFSTNGTFVSTTIAAWNLQIASANQPFRFGGLNVTTSVAEILVNYGLFDLTAGLAPTMTPMDLEDGYVTWANLASNQFTFLAPPYYDPAIGPYTESTKQPFTLGEMLTLGSMPKTTTFTGPALIITGNEDAIYCGGNCTNTGGVAANIPALAASALPMASPFQAYIQPGAGHAINVHFNATGAYGVIQDFLKSNNF
ncbi:MAG: hypothetical protein M1818_002681 [Claussenomyces sp. TS43310]|nr:MAG: hypothetical protein M1818_002681 [Claussenomyces sp. TS43310]